MSLSTFQRSVRIERAPADVFSWHEKPGAFARLAPPWQKIEVLAASGGIQNGDTVKLRSKIGPKWVTWDVEHKDYQAGVQFRDVQKSGPFAHWEHLHRVDASTDKNAGGSTLQVNSTKCDATACTLTDAISYKLPFGALGKLGGGWFAKRELERLFAYRHAVTKADNELALRYRTVRPMQFLIAGASGLVGRALIPFLQTQGHSVIKLVRREARAADEVQWDPAKGLLDSDVMEHVDVVINLSGEGVADGRWSAERKLAIMNSRVSATRTLVAAMARIRNVRFRPFAFISGSATGVYGNAGDVQLTENSPHGAGFLAEVCNEWERAAIAAEELDVRVVRLRTGVVLTPAGGALAKLALIFKAGIGGRLGDGKMWMSWISIDDLVGAIYHAVLDRRCVGAVNAVAPNPVTNAEFTKTLARVLRRPAVLPVPKAALRTVFGEMADETLLTSARVKPAKLEEALYEFRHATLEEALRHVLGRASARE